MRTSPVRLLVAACALATVVGLAGCTSGAPPQDATKLQGVTWSATQIVGANGTLAPVVPDSVVTAAFSGETIAGSGGVNSYSGTFTTSGSDTISIKLGLTTQMAGPEPLMTQEAAFFTALGAATRYAVSTSTFDLLDSTGKTLVRFQVRKSTALKGTTWHCLAYNNGKQAVMSVIATSSITAAFGEDGLLRESAGVNEYNATYTAGTATMTIGAAIASTRMAGPPELMDQETAYLAALPLTARYEIDGDKLTLWGIDGQRIADYAANQP